MRIISDTRGVALISVLIATFALVTALIIAGERVVRLHRTTQLRMESLRARAAAEKAARERTIQFVDSSFASYGEEAITNGKTTARVAQKGDFPAATISAEMRSLAVQASYQVVLRHPPPGTLLLNWSDLLTPLKDLPSPCRDWNTTDEVKESSGVPHSARSCKSLSGPISSPTLFRGELRTTVPVIIHSPVPKNAAIVILGELSAREIQFQECGEREIQIIAAGNIRLTRVTATDSTKLKVLLYSAGGEIVIDEALTELTLCDSSTSSETPKVRLEAAEGISVGGATVSGRAHGCPFPRSSELWREAAVFSESTGP